LNRIYGCAHSSVIGFIAYEWLNLSEQNTVLDGAPSPIVGNGRIGQQYSDLLLCKNQEPYIPFQVELVVAKYHLKLKALYAYFDSFKSTEYGLLFLTNLTSGKNKYMHNWEDIKKTVLGND